jgi:hypothetical protein
MITTFEVGSIFRIVDEASPVLKKLIDQTTALDKIINTTRANIDKLGATPALAPLIAAMQTVRTEAATVNTAITSMSRRMATAQTNASAMAVALNNAATAQARLSSMPPIIPPGRGGVYGRAAAAQARGGGAAPTGGGGVGGGGHIGYRQAGIPVPGGHLHGTGAGFVAAGAAAYSAYESLEVSDIVSRGLANVYPEGLPSDADAKRKELTQAIVDQARMTKLPLKTVSKMALDEIKTNANQPWEARMRILPLVIQSAAREAYVKDTDPEAATSAFVGQLHQIRAFTPEEIAKNAPMIAYFASKDPNSLVNIGKSAAYHTPIATAMMGVPIEEDLAAQTVLDRTGVGGKSGTWLREMVVRAAHPVHDKNYAQKIKLLQGLGLADAAGHPTWMTDGRYDESKELHILNKTFKGISVEERAGRLKQVFGERGAGAVALLTEDKMLAQYDEVLAEARAAQSNTDFWASQNKSNQMQRLRGAAVDVQIAALNAGKIIAPPVVGAAGGLASVLGWAANYLPSPGTSGEKHLEKAGAWGAGGAALGAMLGIPGGFLGIGAGALLGGSVFGAAGYSADVMRDIHGLGGPLKGIKFLNYLFGGQAKADELAPVPSFSDRWSGLPGAVTRPAPSATGTMPTTWNQNIHVEIEAKQTDDLEDFAKKVAHYIAGFIAKSTEHNQGSGEGVLSSPYLSGTN